ncbi:MAG: hypothetical protein IKC20_05190, partial [Clostridia bacterium]|nr:hypothetical protein [Clostridia bacterium]
DRKPSVKKKIEDIKKEREDKKKDAPKAPDKSKSKGKSKNKKKGLITAPLYSQQCCSSFPF